MTVPTTDALLPPPGPEHDTGWFVYGVSRPTLPVPAGLTGVDDQPVQLLPHGDVAAIVSAALLDRPPGRRAELLAYTRVLDTLAVRGPVAPVRFGSILADTDDVVATLLDPSGPQLDALLDELTDRVQLRLQAAYREDVALAEVVARDPEVARLRDLTRDAPEDAYYAERIELGRRVAAAVDELRAADAEAIIEAVRPRCAAIVEQIGSGLDRIVEAQLLVDDEQRPDLEEMLEQLAEEIHERIALRLSGPLAPYDFVGGTPWA